MDDILRILTYLASRKDAIVRAPEVFIFSISAGAFAAWKWTKAHFKERINVLEEKIKQADVWKEQASYWQQQALNPRSDKSSTPPWTLDRDSWKKVGDWLARYQHAKEGVQRVINVYVALGSPENETFALELMDSFQHADWFPVYGGKTEFPRYRCGVWLTGALQRDLFPSTQEIIYSALSAVGIPAAIDPDIHGDQPFIEPAIVVGKRVVGT